MAAPIAQNSIHFSFSLSLAQIDSLCYNLSVFSFANNRDTDVMWACARDVSISDSRAMKNIIRLMGGDAQRHCWHEPTVKKLNFLLIILLLLLVFCGLLGIDSPPTTAKWIILSVEWSWCHCHEGSASFLAVICRPAHATVPCATMHYMCRKLNIGNVILRIQKRAYGFDKFRIIFRWTNGKTKAFDWFLVWILVWFLMAALVQHVQSQIFIYIRLMSVVRAIGSNSRITERNKKSF